MKLLKVVLFMLLLSSCGVDGDKVGVFDSMVENIISEKTVSIDPKTVQIKSGKKYVLYSEGENLTLSIDNKPIIFEKVSAKRYWLHVVDSYVYVFWWVKFNKEKDKSLSGKTLYVRSSQDGGKTFAGTVQINTSHGVLPDLHIVADNQGKVAVVYLDERFPGHQIYSSASFDGGKTWLEEDIRLDTASKNAKPKIVDDKAFSQAVTPSMHLLGNSLVAIWEQIESFDGKVATSFLSRTSKDFGKTWGETELIYRQSERLSVELKSASTAKEVYLMAVLPEGLVLFSKKTDGEWAKIQNVAPGSDEAKIVSFIKTAYDEKYLYISYIYVQGTGHKTWHTELVRFNRENSKWLKNNYRFDAVATINKGTARGGYQDIAILDDGSLVVVWEDFRGIYPSVMMNYSLDKGETWLEKPIYLVTVGTEYANRPFIKANGNKFRVFFYRTILKDQTRPVADARMLSLLSPRTKQFNDIDFPAFTLEAQKNIKPSLKKRMNEIMALRIKGGIDNYQQEWKFIDPIYRANVRSTSWMRTRDLFRYADKYSIDNIDVSGAIALVSGNMTFSFTSGLNGTEDIDPKLLKNKTQPYTAKWGWFYDNWYLIPENPTKSHLP